MIDYAEILTQKYPGTNWVLEGYDYSGLTWLDDSEKPSQNALDALWPEVSLQQQCDEISTKRHQQYILISDPIFFEWQRGTKTQADWENAVEAIKTANPYPTAS